VFAWCAKLLNAEVSPHKVLMLAEAVFDTLKKQPQGKDVHA
jgi:hypothetical protein